MRADAPLASFGQGRRCDRGCDRGWLNWRGVILLLLRRGRLRLLLVVVGSLRDVLRVVLLRRVMRGRRWRRWRRVIGFGRRVDDDGRDDDGRSGDAGDFVRFEVGEFRG